MFFPEAYVVDECEQIAATMLQRSNSSYALSA
jgi:hypothetical protein